METGPAADQSAPAAKIAKEIALSPPPMATTARARNGLFSRRGRARADAQGRCDGVGSEELG